MNGFKSIEKTQSIDICNIIAEYTDLQAALCDNECGDMICNNCIPLQTCRCGGIVRCMECMIKDVKGHVICLSGSCSGRCSHCANIECNKCLSECQSCRQVICERCEERCATCKALLCPDCHFTYVLPCPTCGQDTCPQCPQAYCAYTNCINFSHCGCQWVCNTCLVAQYFCGKHIKECAVVGCTKMICDFCSNTCKNRYCMDHLANNH